MPQEFYCYHSREGRGSQSMGRPSPPFFLFTLQRILDKRIVSTRAAFKFAEFYMEENFSSIQEFQLIFAPNYKLYASSSIISFSIL